MRIVLVRHAQAGPGRPDELRALTQEGRDQARALGARLAADYRVDAVLSSPLRRACQTAEAIAEAAGVPVERTDLLAPGATAEAVLLAASARGETVVAVGHNPDCREVAVALGASPEHGFPPAGYAVIDLPR